jgi:transcriptional regulator GlxA family with amidase domain
MPFYDGTTQDRLCLNGDDNVEAVTTAAGYASQSAFAHAYRRAFATTLRGACKLLV